MDILTFLWFCVICVVNISDSEFVDQISVTKQRLPRQTRNPQVSFNEPGCGFPKTVSTRTKRIIGGQEAAEGEWPWMALLYITSWERTCGAVLITHLHVLTAAHCVRRNIPLDVNDVIVRLGALDLRESPQHEKNFSVEAVHVHEDYKPRSFEYDIALVRLSIKVHFTDYIRPICLPQENFPLELVPAVATGWGRTGFQGPVSHALLKVQITIVRHSHCKTIYRPLKKTIFDSQLCAGGINETRDTCQGDSGGPLMVQNDAKQWLLAGIVSFGSGCAEYLKPGIYTRVTSYLRWVTENLNPAIRVGCPNGFKNFDESLCIHEYWISLFRKGSMSWDQMLDKREKKRGLQPIRKSQFKCPTGYVEYDEFYCLSNFVYQRYQSGKERWESLFSFTRSKVSFQSVNNSQVNTREPSPPIEFMPFKMEAKRLLARRVPCSETAAVDNGLRQTKFDEYYCIHPDYVRGFKSGEIDWYTLYSRKFQKKLPAVVRIGCPDGFKNIDDDLCIDETWLEQYKRGSITWEQLLERRQYNDGLIAKRKTNLKCPSGHIEFDEYYCLTDFFFNRYITGKESWKGLLSFIKQKTISSEVRSEPTASTAIPEKFSLDNLRNKWNRVSCNTTTAAKQGLPQVKFDEIFCISPAYFASYKSGQIDWYSLVAKRFEKKLEVEPDIF